MKKLQVTLKNVENYNSRRFTVEDTAISLSHVHDQGNLNQIIAEKAKYSLLGKRTYNSQTDHDGFVKKLKQENACRACKKLGHWYKDRKQCMDLVLQRRREARAPKFSEKKALDEPPPSTSADDAKISAEVKKSLFPG